MGDPFPPRNQGDVETSTLLERKLRLPEEEFRPQLTSGPALPRAAAVRSVALILVVS